MYYRYLCNPIEPISYFFSKLNFNGVSVEFYKRKVATIQQKLHTYQYDVKSISLQVLIHNLQFLKVDNLEAFDMCLTSILCWCIDYPEFIVYFNMIYRYLLIVKHFDAIDHLEMIYGQRIPVTGHDYSDYLQNIYMLRLIYKIVNPTSKFTIQEKKDLFETVVQQYNWDMTLEYNIHLDLNIQPVMNDMLAIVVQPDDAMDALHSVKKTTILMTCTEKDHLTIDQSAFLLDTLINNL